jgi:ABC-type Mn2+/Zn2+ transport system ATPase subunit
VKKIGLIGLIRRIRPRCPNPKSRIENPKSVHDIISINRLTIRYGESVALDDLNLNIPCGSLVALLGPNGAGKSTLLRTLLGWHPLPKDARITIGDDHLQHQLPRLAYIPQRNTIDWDFPLTVRQLVAQGRYHSLHFWQKTTPADDAIIQRALDELCIADLANHHIRTLSGGQQQRAFLARALAQGADIFLLDEPFTALDLRATEELTHILRSWGTQGRTVLAALHDLPLAREHFTHALLLNTRLVAFGPVRTTLTPANIAATFRPPACVHRHHHHAVSQARP